MDNEKNSLSTELRKKIYFIVRKMMSTTRNFEIEIFNKEKLETNGTTIYAVNHSNYHDIPTVSEISNEHFYLLLGVQKLRIIDRIAFFLLGRIYVDRKNKESKRMAKEQMIDLSSKGNHLLMFPEATWNTTPNKLVLPLNWGIIDIARTTGAKIKPINFEYVEDKCYVNVGDDIIVSKEDDKQTKIDELEESMATLKWETLEKFGTFERCSITEKDFECYTTDRYDEYKPLDVEYEQSVIRKVYDTEEEVFAHFRDIEITKDNVFLLKLKNAYNEKYPEEERKVR